MSLSWPRRAALVASQFLANKGLEGLQQLERDSVGASMLSGILSPRGNPVPRNTRDLLEMYRKAPWLRAVVSKIAFSIASVPWVVKVIKMRGVPVRMTAARQGMKEFRNMAMRAMQLEGGEIATLFSHPALEVISDPNPVIRGLAIRKVAQSHMDLVGETFYLKERDLLGNPVHLWTVPPHWVKQTPTIVHPFYEVQWKQWHGLIPESEMIWACDNDPERPYWRGTGVAEALSDDLDVDEFTAKMLKSTMYNNGVPELLITMENSKRGELKRVEEDWKKQNQGIFRQLRTYFLGKKVEVQQIGMDFRRMELVKLREFERDTIVQTFGVPPEILGILKNSNRATIEAARFLFSQWVMVPRLELWREVYQTDLMDTFDDRAIIDYISPVEEDFEQALAARKAAPHASSLEEWRSFMGMNPEVDPKHTFFVPKNLEVISGSDVSEGGQRGPTTEEKEWDSMKALGLTDGDRPKRLAA